MLFKILRLIIHLLLWTFFMGYTAIQVVFENEYWQILMFFIFLFLFIVTIREVKDVKKRDHHTV